MRPGIEGSFQPNSYVPEVHFGTITDTCRRTLSWWHLQPLSHALSTGKDRGECLGHALSTGQDREHEGSGTSDSQAPSYPGQRCLARNAFLPRHSEEREIVSTFRAVHPV